MIINTSELTGAALDWAVAKCEGAANLRRNIHPFNDDWIVDWPAGEGLKPRVDYLYEYSPSTDWTQAGPIIDRDGLGIGKAWNRDEWLASARDIDADVITGPTALIAAMRCYVASKLGSSVDVPEGLS